MGNRDMTRTLPVPAGHRALAVAGFPAAHFGALFGALVAALVAGCGLGDRQAGVVSETTNGLAGRAVDAEGRGAAAARVSWRPADFLPQEGPKTRGDTGSTAAGPDGAWRTGSLPAGEYLLTVRSVDGRVAAFRRRLAAGAARDSVGEVRVERAGRITVQLAASAAGTARIRVYGTDLLAEATGGDTAVLEGLGAESYRVQVIQGGKAQVVPGVPVAAASLTRLDGVDPAQGTVQVTPPSAQALDSALVMSFLSGSGALKTAAFDSVVLRKDGRIVGLDLAGIPLDSVPASVGALVFLDTLRLNACKLKALPDTLFSLDSLESLNLSYNSGLAVSNRLYAMPALAQLDLSGLDLSAVDPALASMPALRELRLNSNPLGQVPSALLGLPSLRILALSDCGLDSLPDVFSAGHALEKLLLDRNNLTALPASLRLLKLGVLYLGQNRLCDIPAETRTFIEAVPLTDSWTTTQAGC